MKPLIFCFLLSIFAVSGCAFLRGGDEADLDDSYQEEGMSEGEEMEEENLAEEDLDETEEMEVEDEEFVAEGEEEEMEEKESEGGGLRGFFSRIFGSEEEEEPLEEGEGDFVDDGMADAEDSETYEDYTEEEYPPEAEPLASDAPVGPPAAEAPSPPEPPASPPKPGFIPLNKIIAVPYRKAGYLVNAVYIARPGDTLESLSQKIYGSNQTEALRSINSHLQARAVKVGDKIYYNSPNRQNDESKLLFYYQDIMAPSASYSLSPGENIRQVSSQLLGHPNSWKEIWATNPELESKGEITRNMSIVYWPVDTAAEPQPLAEPQPDSKPEETVSEDLIATGPEAESALPPVPGEEASPLPQAEDFPLPPPSASALSSPAKDKKIGFLQIIFQQQGLILALAGIIAALILMIRLILKKRKQKDFDYTATNIEI